MGGGRTRSGAGVATSLAGLVVAMMLLSVTAAASLAGCAGKATPALLVTAKASDTTITVVKGTIVTVKLAENPTAGYEWKMIVGPGLSLASSTLLAPSPAGVVGAGGTHVWAVRAEQAGTRTLTGVYERSWESKSAASFSLTIVVK